MDVEKVAFFKKQLAKGLVSHQGKFFRILLEHPGGLTREEIAARMYSDSHKHRIAGILAGLSKTFIPHHFLTDDGNNYLYYLKTKHAMHGELLILSDELRRALNDDPEFQR